MLNQVLIDNSWGAELLKVTDETGRVTYHRQMPCGDLTRGVPHVVIDQGWMVSLFMVDDQPHLLNVERSR